MRNLLFIAAIFFCASLGAAEAKMFPEYKCVLALPNDSFEWIETKDGTAACMNKDGLVLMLKVDKAGQHDIIDRDFAKGFKEGFVRNGVADQVAGELTKFRGVPSCRVHARMPKLNSFLTAQVFFANGYFYQLHVLEQTEAPSPPEGLDSVFNAFSFIGKPDVPTAQPLSLFEVISQVGGLAFAAILIAVVIKHYVKKHQEKKQGFS